MAFQEQKMVAVISPWEKLAALVKEDFRIESIPGEKKVMAWREDLQDPTVLAAELKSLKITPLEIGPRKVTSKWQDIA